ncbi:MAG: metallophosphatase family protein [Anaerolineales bacterium]|nr:metallophosphatase family protein [Anaerolineales bacterium]
MRFAILADIHANLPALEAVLADARKNRADAFIVAGDQITGGPHPNETMDALRSLENCWMIRGNTDDYLLQFAEGTASAAQRASRQWATARWSADHFDKEHLKFVAALPEQRVVECDGAMPIRVVHGTPLSSTDHLMPEYDAAIVEVFVRALTLRRDHVPFDHAIADVSEAVLICGHSHIAWNSERNGRLVINPGSVGAPINGDVRAQYALLTWRAARWQVEQRFVEYDIARTRAAYRESSLLDEGGGMARAFLLDAEVGRNVSGKLVRYAFRLAADAGFPDCEVVPDAIWDRAVTTFDWDAASKT